MKRLAIPSLLVLLVGGCEITPRQQVQFSVAGMPRSLDQAEARANLNFWHPDSHLALRPSQAGLTDRLQLMAMIVNAYESSANLGPACFPLRLQQVRPVTKAEVEAEEIRWLPSDSNRPAANPIDGRPAFLEEWVVRVCDSHDHWRVADDDGRLRALRRKRTPIAPPPR